MLAHFNDPNSERLRSNDGAADPRGMFWIGSMTDLDQGEFQPEGSLFRFSTDGKEEVVKHLTIPKSVGWSPGNRTMFLHSL
ncbi:SMP-30/Gluconolaconase/LRE-like region [Metarhizium rileyi]|uniref:SMP-30/Gluconolaconase/LRE-like region n=1 Tax=Metarhizium rileyi (strain RCEF 4871) TaxID=1649241 RepID=A0A167AFF0_METRR|nr:SMP-30/Gluconolaconase/LRE-like region [Metarhizium rileyi RCEF 4871]TWU77330.1 hypothetical protein ED733_005298 [Metarhizium rileyi]